MFAAGTSKKIATYIIIHYFDLGKVSQYFPKTLRHGDVLQ